MGLDNFWKRKYFVSDNRNNIGDLRPLHEVNTTTRNEMISLESFTGRKGIHPYFYKVTEHDYNEFEKGRYKLDKREHISEKLKQVYIRLEQDEQERHLNRSIHKSLKDFYEYIGWDNKKRKWKMLKGEFNIERFERYLLDHCGFDPALHTWSLSKNFTFGFDVFEKETNKKIFHYHASFVNPECTYNQMIDELIDMENRMGQSVKFDENDD